MKKLLFVYPDLNLGGSTTALLTLLNELDYAAVSVDLLLLQNGNTRLDLLPKQVNVLTDAAPFDLWAKSARRKKLLNSIFTGKVFKTLWIVVRAGKKPFIPYLKAAVNQMLAQIHCDICPRTKQRYDTAVAFMELWPTAYVAKKCEAKQKVAWVHVDYIAARLAAKLDEKTYGAFDKIVCVSSENAQKMRRVFPSYASKIAFCENPIDVKEVKRKSLAGPTEFDGFDGFRILTVARLDSYTKGIDRLLSTAFQLKKEKFLFMWCIVGAGEDEKLKKRAEKLCVANSVLFLGQRENPYPYYTAADLFVLTSRNEGKPVTVSEAQILGLPALVTEYAAAKEQISNGKNGVILPNKDDAPIAETIIALAENPAQLKSMRDNLKGVASAFHKEDFKKILKL